MIIYLILFHLTALHDGIISRKFVLHREETGVWGAEPPSAAGEKPAAGAEKF